MAPIVWADGTTDACAPDCGLCERTKPKRSPDEVAALIGEALSMRRGPSMRSGEPDRWSPDTKEEADE